MAIDRDNPGDLARRAAERRARRPGRRPDADLWRRESFCLPRRRPDRIRRSSPAQRRLNRLHEASRPRRERSMDRLWLPKCGDIQDSSQRK